MENTAPAFLTNGVPALVLSFWITSAPHWTVTSAVLEPPPSLPVATVAVLLTSAQSALVVADVMWIGPMLEFPPRLANVQLRVWDFGLATFVIEQPEKAGLSDQSRSPPAPNGRGSLIVTLVAAAGLLFLNVMSKPMFP